MNGKALFALVVAAVLATQGYGQALFHDDFEDNSINTTYWVYGGGARGTWQTDPLGTGPWTSSMTAVTATDGYFLARVQGPTSGSTYGAEAWIKSTQDFNDGNSYVINFTWSASTVGNDNYAMYHIQLTNGTIPDPAYVHWALDGLNGTYDLLKQRDDNNDLHCGAFLPDGQTKATWSMLIDPTGTATLYDHPDATGALLGQESLDANTPWHFRMMVVGATSGGFPAKDTSLSLYDVTVTPEPATLSLLMLGGLGILRRKKH